MFIANKEGNLQFNPKWVETFIQNSDNLKKKNLNFFSHVGSNKNNINNIMRTITTEKEYDHIPNQIKGNTDMLNEQKIHLSFWFENISLESIRNFKFMFSLSEVFFIYLTSNQDIFADSDYLIAIQSLFIFSMLDCKIQKPNMTSVCFVLSDNSQIDLSSEKKNIVKKLNEIWEKCLEISDFDKNLSIENFFEIDFILSSNFAIKKDSFEMKKSKDINKSILVNPSCTQDLIVKKWIDSQNVPLKLLSSIKNKDIDDQISFYFSDSLFYKIIQIMNQIFKKWNKIVCRGKIIKDYGNVLSNFVNCIKTQFDASIPISLENSFYIKKKKAELLDILQEKAAFFFTRQVLNLQSQALDKFKDLLLKATADSKISFESVKKVSIENTNNWFVLNARNLLSDSIKLSYYAAQKELNNVLFEFAEKFKDSPVIKLQSLQRLEKQTSVSGLKQSGIVIGFGLTAAFRPSGFGNFQLITSYTQGPHIFNFSLVNDKDVAEQEGQGKIKTFRIQPSLSFDVEL